MKISIVIPVYNEANTIARIIDIVKNAPLPENLNREIVVVNDCSTDGTKAILEKLNQPELKIIHHQKNQGKGAALRTGFQNCSGEIVIIQDADLEYNPNEYPQLLEPILKEEADVVYGSRFIGSKPHRILYFWHSIGNKLLTLCSNMLSDLNLTDMETCYKVFKKLILDQISIEENRFGFEPEVTAKIAHLAREKNITIYEVGISYHGRTYKEGKKIGLKDAVRAFWCILKYNDSGLARATKYILNGTLIAISQFATIIILVQLFHPQSNLMQNVAYAISIEVSIIVGFLLHSFITWRHKYRSGGDFFKKAMIFHLITSFSFIIRQVIFYIFSTMNMNYLINTLIGIGIAMILNFVGYDRLIFNKLLNDNRRNQ